MTPERYKELSDASNSDAILTDEEVKEGWHFCWDWDGMLIGPDMPEIEFCNCIHESTKGE